MFDTIEEAYKELLPYFNENQYNLKIEENILSLNIEIEHSHKKNIIPFILQKNEIKNDDLIKSLFIIVNNYAKENNGLKIDINNLNNKVNQMEKILNSIENKIDIILSYINDKIKEKDQFEKVLEKSKIINNKNQISLLKKWLPFKNKNDIKCKLIYDAKRDGDQASTFHSLCDNKESTITIISTSDNKKIGGFLSKYFDSYNESISDKDAFLFSLDYSEKYPSLNKGYIYQHQSNKGPIFGRTCIHIDDQFLKSNQNYYNSFTSRYDFGKRSNKTDYYFQVINLEIYQIFE